jgi:hypothetical protein
MRIHVCFPSAKSPGRIPYNSVASSGWMSHPNNIAPYVYPRSDGCEGSHATFPTLFHRQCVHCPNTSTSSGRERESEESLHWITDSPARKHPSSKYKQIFLPVHKSDVAYSYVSKSSLASCILDRDREASCFVSFGLRQLCLDTGFRGYVRRQSSKRAFWISRFSLSFLFGSIFEFGVGSVRLSLDS